MTLPQQVLAASRQADRETPARLQTNRVSDCVAHVTRVVALLREQGLPASFMGKTSGEAQYTPPQGFPVTIGPHRCTGVSHDAIWVAERQFDLIGQANDGPEPLGIPALPVANEIPAAHHRPNNPPIYPLPQAAPVPVPPPAPAPKPYPGDVFFVEQLGGPLAADYAQAGQTLNAGAITWVARTLWRHIAEGMPLDASVAQSRKEWRAALGLPPQ